MTSANCKLAKCAIAGSRILLERCRASANDLTRIYLAGAFGDYMNHTSVRRIGAFGSASSRVRHVSG